jgi:hypothetical protein
LQFLRYQEYFPLAVLSHATSAELSRTFIVAGLCMHCPIHCPVHCSVHCCSLLKGLSRTYILPGDCRIRLPTHCPIHSMPIRHFCSCSRGGQFSFFLDTCRIQFPMYCPYSPLYRQHLLTVWDCLLTLDSLSIDSMETLLTVLTLDLLSIDSLHSISAVSGVFPSTFACNQPPEYLHCSWSISDDSPPSIR